ncbi:type II secretory pathway component PulM [Haloferula luteola]|uniref:Type II secretory pathway component PulM n=1 Tax=Haloferula luteola TaxID=595692 RepID=A0A840V1N7_9BACT|nr:hypothetical protein [Haloferula luteola]MBB5352257.1 type II secretory pathway component PulM [Haloferula luteola]
MNDREKKLLIGLGVALFGVANLGAFKYFETTQKKVVKQIQQHEQTLEIAQFAREQSNAVQGEIEWLEKNQKDPKEAELVPSELEKFVTGRAAAAGLTLTRPKILDNRTDGAFFERARFQISVSGKEEALYRWLTELQSPKDFRAITALRLSPNREDDTLIDAVVQVEEWFQPKVP